MKSTIFYFTILILRVYDSSYASIFSEYYTICTISGELGNFSLKTLLHLDQLGNGSYDGLGCYYNSWEDKDFYLVFANDGTGAFSQIESLPFESKPVFLTGDFNGDGLSDLLSKSDDPDTGFRTFFRNSSGFSEEVYYCPPFPCSGVDVEDFNDDSYDDICGITEGRICLLYGDGTGSFTPVVCSDYLGVAYETRCAEFDNDGDSDILVIASDAAIFMDNIGTNYFSVSCSFPILPFSYLTSISLSDLDNNGYNDAILTSNSIYYETLFYTYMNYGDMSFTESMDILGQYLPYCAVTTELDPDAYPDLAINLSGTLSIYKGIGDGTFEEDPSLYQGTEFADVVFADFNQDGASDMAAVNTIAGYDYYLSIFLNSSTSSFTSTDLAVPAGSVLAAIPNPFANAVVIFTEGSDSAAQLTVYSIYGRVISEISADHNGVAVWDGSDWTGNQAPAGTYIVTAGIGPLLGSIKIVKLQ